MRVWIDIDNPPQVQYLLPVAEALAAQEEPILLTARAYGRTVDMLRQREARVTVVGREFGAARAAKLVGVARRAGALIRIVQRWGRPDVLISSSRSSAVAARLLRVPCFIVSDYEHSELGIYRRMGATILHPEIVPASAFVQQGWRPEQLCAFPGIKEDLTFAGVDTAAVKPWTGAGDGSGLRRVLVRPPAEESHYFDPRSRTLALEVLEALAADAGSVVVFSPRHDHQVDDLQRFTWHNDPVVLHRPVPFLQLLAGVDLVVCAGGTMLREAAYLGIPAISIFQSAVGAVDQALEAEGRLRHVDDADQFRAVLAQAPPRQAPRTAHRAVDELIAAVRSRVGA